MPPEMPSAATKGNPSVLIGIITGAVASVLVYTTARTHEHFAIWPKIFAAAIASCFDGEHPSIAHNLWRIARELGAFATMSATIWALGGPLVRRLDGEDRTFARIGLGAIALHFLMFALAAAQLWYRPLIIAIALAGTLSATYSLVRAPPDLRGTWSYLRERPLFALAIAFIIIAAIEGLGPETGADAGMYHVGAPNHWLLEHGFHLIRDHYASNLPLPQSMFYGFLLALGPSDSTRLFQPAMLLLAAFALHRTARAKVPIEVWALLAVPALNGYLAISGNDHFAIAFFALGLLFGLRKHIALAFLFLGFALTAKYTMAVQVLLAAAYVARFERPRLAHVALLFGPALLWAAKSAVLTGNPVYPWLPSVFGDAYQYAPGIARAIESNQTMLRSPLHFIAFPVVAALNGSLMHNGGVHWLLLAPIAFVIGLRHDRRETLIASAFLALGWISWALLYENARYSGPLFAATGLACSVAMRPARRWITAPVMALLVWSAIASWAYRLELTRPWTFVCGRFDEVRYVTEQHIPITVSPPHEMFAFLNASLDHETARVLLVGETRTAGLDVRHISGNEYDRPIFAPYVEGAGSVEEVIERMRRDSITHVAINRGMATYFEKHNYGVLRVSEPAGKLWNEMLAKCHVLAEKNIGEHDWSVVALPRAGD